MDIIKNIASASIYTAKTILNTKPLRNVKEKLIREGLFYGVGAMNAIYGDDSIFAGITEEEMRDFNTAHPIVKYNILNRLLYSVIPKDKKIKISKNLNASSQENTSSRIHNLSEHINESDYNLLGYITKNADKPLDDISRLLLPFKFSNLSWYINNQLVNNINYIEILEIISLFDAFIDVEGHERFFYNYIQKVKLTGITTADIEFILSLIWFIMETDLADEYCDIYKYERTATIDKKYELVELKNIFNIIFHIENANLTGFKNGINALSSLGITDVFLKDIKTNLIDTLSEPYKTQCTEQIYTLTFAQYIAALILSIKNDTPLAMINLGCFQKIFDEVLYKQPNIQTTTIPENISQNGGSVLLTATVAAFLKPALTVIYENSTFILSSLDTVSKKYLDFLYAKNITYTQLKKLILDNNYTDSFIYIIEDTKNPYPYLRALLLTMQFKDVLTVADRKMFIKTTNPSQLTTTSSKLFYKHPPTDFTPFANAFDSIKFKIQSAAINTFDTSFVFAILAVFGGSWGSLIKSYQLINEKLKSDSDISTYTHFLNHGTGVNVFNDPARVILNAYNKIQNDKNLVVFLRQLMLYQIIYTNTYLLVVDTIATRNIITGKINPSGTNYKHAKELASKIASLLFQKNNESVNVIVYDYINICVNAQYISSIFNKFQIKILKKCIDFNHTQNIILEVDKYYIDEKIGLLKEFKSANPNTPTISLTSNSNVSHVTEKSTSSSAKNNTFYDAPRNITPEQLNQFEKNALYREKIFCFFKRIFQYNLAMTSFDIENLLEFSINNSIIICNETRDILEFYSNKHKMYELYMPVDLTKKINFLEY